MKKILMLTLLGIMGISSCGGNPNQSSLVHSVSSSISEGGSASEEGKTSDQNPSSQDSSSKEKSSESSLSESESSQESAKAEAVLSAIRVITLPEKREYMVGDKLDLTGLKVMALYSSGEQKEVTAEIEVSPITLEQVGKTVIKISYSENGVEVFTSFEVTVIEKTVYPQTITLNKKELVLDLNLEKTNASFRLLAEVLPLEAEDKSVFWVSENKGVANVEDGLVTAINEGETTITATTVNGLSASCEVRVIDTTPSPVEDKLIQLESIDSFDFHTDLQTSFLEGDNYLKVEEYARGEEELSKPKELVLSFEIDESLKGNAFNLDISDDYLFRTYDRYVTEDTSVTIKNLKLSTTYFWKVSTGKNESDVSYFSTPDSLIRNIDIDGVTNARDIGGASVFIDGREKRIKQGLIYRSGRINVSWKDEKEYQITENGIKTMKEELGIRSEIDLRRTTDGESAWIQNSALGTDVNYFDCHCNYDSEDYLVSQKAGIKSMFNALFDVSNLPAFFHCDIGTDRTGANAFILGALLGKNEKQLYQDYLFSNFGNIGGSRSVADIDSRVSPLKDYEGDDLQEKAFNYLLSIGLKQDKIQNFIDYCLE